MSTPPGGHEAPTGQGPAGWRRSRTPQMPLEVPHVAHRDGEVRTELESEVELAGGRAEVGVLLSAMAAWGVGPVVRRLSVSGVLAAGIPVASEDRVEPT